MDRSIENGPCLTQAHKSQIGKKEVKSLEFYGKRVGNFGVEILSKHIIPNLESLNLSQNEISGEGVRILNEKTNWPNLITLDLWKNKIGDEGTTELSKNTSWKNLTTLYLTSNKIGARE